MFRNSGRQFVGNRFLSKLYSINPVQYYSNTSNRISENSSKKNDNSPITSSHLCFHKRQFSISSSRNYCKNEESEKPSKKFWPIEYDDELEVGLLPSLFEFFGICYKIFKIKSNYWPTFDKSDILRGSKMAVESLTEKIAEGNFDSLRGLVTDELLDQIKEGFGPLTFEERQKFIIKSDEILSYGIKKMDIIEDEHGTSIEILVVSHAIRNLEDVKQLEFQDEFIKDNLYVLNYGFVRDVTDEDWTVYLMIHSRLEDEMEGKKKKLFKELNIFQKPPPKKK